MNTETKELARQLFATIMTTAQGLGTISFTEREELFKHAAELCFEAATAFEKVASTK
jgi:hypothetical protein